MEPLEAEVVAGVSFLDDLLDLSPDGFPDFSTCRRRRDHKNPLSHHNTAIQQPTPSEEENSRASLVDDEFFELDSFPALVAEEELEWLSNKEVFPTLDTFEIPSHHNTAASPPNIKCHRPVSVLECVTDGSIGGGGEGFPPLLVPVRARSKGRRKRMALCVLAFTASEEEQSRVRRRCLHCEAEETPQWRAGPHGPQTLCNACGVRYKSGRLVPEYRPANSPSFSSVLHSNSHRKIVEMRRMKEGAAAAETVARKKKRNYLIL